MLRRLLPVEFGNSVLPLASPRRFRAYVGHCCENNLSAVTRHRLRPVVFYVNGALHVTERYPSHSARRKLPQSCLLLSVTPSRCLSVTHVRPKEKERGTERNATCAGSSPAPQPGSPSSNAYRADCAQMPRIEEVENAIKARDRANPAAYDKLTATLQQLPPTFGILATSMPASCRNSSRNSMPLFIRPMVFAGSEILFWPITWKRPARAGRSPKMCGFRACGDDQSPQTQTSAGASQSGRRICLI